MKGKPAFDADGLQFAWNSTSIGLAEQCLRKYELKNIQGWNPKSNNMHLRFGGHYASALEHYFKWTSEGMSNEDALISVVEEALVETWDHELDDEGNRIPGTGEAWDTGDSIKNRFNLIRTIVWYFEHFANDPAPVLQTASGPAVERSFAFEVDDGLLFSGHLDRVVEYQGNPYVMDQKTTKYTITPRYFEQFKPNTQMSMYTFAGKMVFDTPVKGVIIDGAQIAVGFTRFERGFTHRTEDELNEWYDSAMYYIQEARKATRNGFFPMNSSACDKYGGCEFRHICNRSPSIRDQFLKGDFEQTGPMDPLEHR